MFVSGKFHHNPKQQTAVVLNVFFIILICSHVGSTHLTSDISRISRGNETRSQK